MIEKIRQWMKIAQSRQMSYANKVHNPLAFAMGDKVFLEVA